MGLFSIIRKGAGALAGGARMISKIPGVGMIPGVGNIAAGLGTAATLYGGYKALSKGFGGGGGGGAMPPMPSIMGGGVLPNRPETQGGFNLPIPWFRGAGGKFQMPWNDPTQMFGPPFAYDDSVLKITTRAPKGFVKVKDPKGREYAMARFLAVKMGLFHPAKKPLISVKETSAIRHAGAAIKKLQNAEKMAKKIANWKTPRHYIEKKGRK